MIAPASQRYHALDALRASMMLLGIGLHAAASYAVVPLGLEWPYKDAQTSPVCDLALSVIHLFRMPVFFVAAGVFAAMLVERDGTRAFIANRTRRVLLPLALFWPIVIPAAMAGFLFTHFRAGTTLDVSAAELGPVWRRPLLGHLWFLWDLMIFYAFAVLSRPLASRISERWNRRIDSAFGALATTTTGALAMSLVTAITLLTV